MMDSINKKLIFAYREDKLGQGDVIYSWQPGCKWLAFCGDTRVVIIVDRLGKKVVEFPLKLGGRVKQMEFDCEGDTIALIQEHCSIVTIINIYTKKILEVDIDKSNKDKPTCIRWGKNHSILGIGTQIGLIYYYNKKSDKIYPLSFNHNKAVTTADWNDEGNLATGDENSSLSVTNKQGEPILQNATLKSDPKMIKWARQKTNDNKNSYTTISTVLNSKTILIYDIKKKSNPIELALDSDYGNIVTYQWFGDGYIAIGFSKGYISIISTHMNEIKNEVHSMQPFKTGLDDLNVCEEVNRIAIAGENSVKIYDTNLWSEIVEEKIEISNQAGRISKIQWSATGHILIISTYLGSIFAFNVIVNDVFAVHKNNFSTLWSLNEACTYEIQQNVTQKLYQIQLFEEPRSLSISGNNLVANYGTKIQIFKTQDIMKLMKEDKGIKVNLEGIMREFQSIINLICLNKDYIAILSEGRVHFAKIESENAEKIFPLKDTDDQILYVCLTDNLIIYSDSNNKVKVYNIIDNCANIGEYRFDNPIKKIFPNHNGTKYLCVDNLGKGFLYNPISESVIPINNDFEFLNIIWDSQDSNTFAAYTRTNQIFTYYFVESSLEGAKVNIIKDFAYIEEINNPKILPYSMKLDTGCYPFFLNNGYLYYYAKSTKEIKGSFLLSHYWIFNWRDASDTDDGHKKYFMQNYQLGRYWNCMKAIAFIKTNQEDYYDCLGKESLKNLNVDVAEEAFRKAKNTSLVLTVEKLREIHEKKILLGHIASILGEEAIAQDLFTDSSKPEYALDLRIDLQDWHIALKLAKDFKPYKEQYISRKIAYQQETSAAFAEALKLYEKSLIVDIAKFLDESDGEHDRDDVNDHNTQCYAGIARCSFRLGDTNRGINLAQELFDKNLIMEIASLCENLNYPLEAAKLYQQTNMFEKAASIFIQMKHFKSAEALIDKIKSPKLLQQLARMKEAEKLYKDAESAYELAGDWESVIRINLKYLDNPLKARDILMLRCKSETAALMISDYYESKGKKKETIEYKLIAKRFEEAFTIAQSYNEMDTYADFFIKDNKNIEEFKKIAQYYEGKNLFGKSGLFFEKSGNYQKALRMYIKGMNDEYLEKAVEMVGNVKDTTLINELIEYFLTSSFDNGPHYLTKLYVLLGNYRQACDIAINLAEQEQELSNYKNAHHLLMDLYKALKDRNLPVSNELNHRLAVLHSYILAKKYIISKQHMKAARNLLRVANNIAMFEKDTVNILTTVVIECAEVGLNRSASQNALILMQDRYKNFIKDAYRSKIDKISRKAYKQEEEAMQTSSPCPFCSSDIPDYNLTCDKCMNILPFCIGSGRHITLNELITCPHCQFPCISSEMNDLLKNDRLCPMCDCEINQQMLNRLPDPIVYLKSRKIAAFDSREKSTENKEAQEDKSNDEIREIENS